MRHHVPTTCATPRRGEGGGVTVDGTTGARQRPGRGPLDVEGTVRLEVLEALLAELSADSDDGRERPAGN